MKFTLAKLISLKVLPLLLLVLTLTVSVTFAQKSANKGGSGGGGGKGGSTPAPTPVPTPVPTNPLPQTPPAPDIIYRESFGIGPDLVRPTGGKGTLKETYIHNSIQNFWVEYPGSKNTAWITPGEGQTWRFCASSDNPHEIFSPLQLWNGSLSNGCAASEWFDSPTENPTALLPFTAPTTAYEVSLNGYPAPIAGKYLALGLTNSSVTYSNLENSGNVVLFLKPAPPYMNWTILYELRVGGLNGTLLASGETYFDGFNQMRLRYDPVGKTVGANVNGTDLGTFPLNLGSPRYAGFEGIAIADNFVIRKLQ